MRKLRVLGDMTINAGEYEGISAIGTATVMGDIKVEKMKVVGDLISKYFIECDDASVMGDIRCENMRVNKTMNVLGEVDTNGAIEAKELKITGEVTAKRGVTGNVLKVVGELNTDGNCEFDLIKSVGKLNIDGLMTGDNIEVCLGADCTIGEIGGENITVTSKLQKGFSFFSSSTGNKCLKCDTIEGENITLENTICKVVRGTNIEIKEGCKIELVEATENLNIDKDSEVKETIWKKN